MHNIAVFMGKMGVFAPSAQIILSCQFPEYSSANCAIDCCAANVESAFLRFVRNDLRRPETLQTAEDEVVQFAVRNNDKVPDAFLATHGIADGGSDGVVALLGFAVVSLDLSLDAGAVPPQLSGDLAVILTLLQK
jgi:hypothetical protein